jgi:small multidrug resistance family-3 protein
MGRIAAMRARPRSERPGYRSCAASENLEPASWPPDGVAAAALAEIAGCFAFWVWMNHGKSPLWLLPGIVLLVTFAWLLTLAPTENAGRAFAIYGGIYIAASIGWLWAVDGVRLDRWDLIGSMVCIIGAGIILWGPRTA